MESVLGVAPAFATVVAAKHGLVCAVRREGIPMASNGIPQIDIAPMLAGDAAS